MDRTILQAAQSFVRLVDGELSEQIDLRKEWHGKLCQAYVTNRSQKTVHIREVVLFAGPMTLASTSAFYGEGFQTLSQTAGTPGSPEAVSKYTDHGHYRMPQTPGMITAYNAVVLAEYDPLLMAFTSCRRFNGSFRISPERFEIVLDTEGLALAPQQSWELEEFFCETGPDRDELFAQLAAHIERHHPRLKADIPAGWCSWYHYGPQISEQDIFENMQAISAQIPELRYIQIDDGYQQAMGDWLTPGQLFREGMPSLCQKIRSNGFEPAIWVAPFIAEQGSLLLQEHPDWFVKDADGQPLRSDQVSFGGWRKGPWYMLDGTHPAAQSYLEQIFRVMREEWGCQYFKLDALMWGAMQGGRRYDASASRVEAYRQGMQAMLRGAGPGSFLLGCNAPVWPSLGLVHGMRVSGDIARNWNTIASVAHECFWRNWQHNRLWVNDPDCVVLANKPRQALLDNEPQTEAMTTVTEAEFLLHATAIYATGGMVLSGDKMTALTKEHLAILRKLLPPTGVAARFADLTQQIGRVDLGDRLALCLFNWEERPCRLNIPLDGTYQICDYWTGADLGLCSGSIQLDDLPPHSARLLMCYPVTDLCRSR